MSTMRVSLVGTVILMLLGSLSVAAQSEEMPTPAFVTGNEVCQLISTATLAEETASVERWRGYTQECVDDMSDSRVTGTFTNVANWDDYRALDKNIIWGTHVLDGPTGGWDCSYAGTNDPTGANEGLVLSICPGTGEFDGLTYVFQHVWGTTPDPGIVDGDFGNGTSIFGLIFEGASPVTLEAVEEPAE